MYWTVDSPVGELGSSPEAWMVLTLLSVERGAYSVQQTVTRYLLFPGLAPSDIDPVVLVLVDLALLSVQR